MNRRTIGAAGLIAFVIWSVIVHVGITRGTRHSAWLPFGFASWPTHISDIDGSANIELSIVARFADAPPENVVGRADIGTDVDWGDSQRISGSRFVTPRRAGVVSSMAVYVAGPIDDPPFDQFQLAIYTDDGGAPGRLVETSAVGTLVADSWNEVAIEAELPPGTACWLMYNTNGRSDGLNNATYRHVTAGVVDAVVQTVGVHGYDAVSAQTSALGDSLRVTIAIVAVAVVGRRRRVAAVVMLAGYVVAVAVAYALREWVFDPFGQYPSGHALRTVYLAAALAWLIRRRWLTALGVALCMAVCAAAVYERGHYTEEIVGGLLLGASVAILLRGLVERGELTPRTAPARSGPARRAPGPGGRSRAGD